MDFLSLAGKRFLVFGVANRKSVAYHITRVLEQAGAVVVHVVRSEAVRARVAKLVPHAEILTCDVEREDEVAALSAVIHRVYLSGETR